MKTYKVNWNSIDCCLMMGVSTSIVRPMIAQMGNNWEGKPIVDSFDFDGDHRFESGWFRIKNLDDEQIDWLKSQGFIVSYGDKGEQLLVHPFYKEGFDCGALSDGII